MSGKPNQEDVRLFKFALERMTKAGSRVSVLQKEIAKREEELKNQQQEFGESQKLIFMYLDKMDVLSEGNFGYQPRMSWFLSELYRQLTKSEQSISASSQE